MFFTVGALTFLATLPNSVAGSQTITDASTTDLDKRTDELFNGFGTKGAPIDECVADPVPLRSFEDNKFIFNENEGVEDGLGPVYNAPGCGNCHDNPDFGGASQMRELRAGHLVNGAFSLPQPLQGLGVIKTWTAPTSNEVVPVTFKQAIGSSDPVRTGTYAKTLTFTLSTTAPK